MPTTEGSASEQRLLDLAKLAAEADNASVADRASKLARRLAEGRYFVACVGQFKRGKSTLINALIGDSLLPMGVAPVTSVVTVVRFGVARRVRIQTAAGGWQEVDPSALRAYVAQDENPDNRKGVLAAEVFAPCALLANGMCLVDTPGLGSVFAANTEAVRAFVPHVDAALVVLGGDPPISGDELELVAEVARHVTDLVFVMNKADRLSETERRDSRAFTESTLSRRLAIPPPMLFEVSAVERLRGGPGNPAWAALVETLRRLTVDSGSTLIARAERRGLDRLVADLAHDLDERREALERPVVESEARLESLARCVADARRAMRDLGYLFDAEQRSLSDTFGARTQAFLASALPMASAALADRIAAIGDTTNETTFRDQAFTIAQALSETAIKTWARELEPEAEALYRRATERFVLLANEFLERLARSGGSELERLGEPLGPEAGFRVRSRFFHHDHLTLTGTSPVDRLLDRVRSSARSRRAAQRAAGAYLERLLGTNSSRVQNDLIERVLESRRCLEREIEARLSEIVASAGRALDGARAVRAAGAEALAAELARIDNLHQRLQWLQTTQGDPLP